MQLGKNMMRTSHALRAALAALLLAQGVAAVAGPVSEWRYIGDFQPTAASAGLATDGLAGAGLGTRFDTSSWNDGASASTGAALTLDAQATAAVADASTAAADERRRALASAADTSNTSPVVGSPASLQLTLWNFIANIRAQQASDPFVQLQTSAANIDYTLNAVPAPVPLPPAAWLFGGGIAALLLLRRALRAGARGNPVVSPAAA
jgi:hypothetical protein